MEPWNPSVLLDLAKNFGAIGLLAVMWWQDSRAIRGILDMYKADMQEMRQMYKNNVHLVEGYESLAKDLRDTVIMNTQAMTEVCTDIRDNQFCPMVRLKKQTEGVIG